MENEGFHHVVNLGDEVEPLKGNSPKFSEQLNNIENNVRADQPPPESEDKSSANYLRDPFYYVFFIGIVCVIIYIAWICDPPSPEFRINSVSIYPFNVSVSQLSSNWNISFSITNHNKYARFYYSNVVASVFYKEELLLVTNTAPFYQVGNDTAFLNTSFSNSQAIVENWAAKAIAGDRIHRQEVDFNVMVKARVSLYPGTSREFVQRLEVTCDDVKVKFPSNTTIATMSGETHICKVDLFLWID